MLRFAKLCLGAAAFSLAGLTASAQTVCNAETTAGVWIAAGEDLYCRVNAFENERFRGTCRDDDDFPPKEIELRGRMIVDENCQISGPMVITDSGVEVRVWMRGYAWGGNIPMAMHIVTTTPGVTRGFTFIRPLVGNN